MIRDPTEALVAALMADTLFDAIDRGDGTVVRMKRREDDDDEILDEEDRDEEPLIEDDDDAQPLPGEVKEDR